MKYTSIILLFALFILGSCNNGGNKNQSNNSDSGTHKLKIGYIPIADCSQAFVAQEKGFFKDEGLDVELVSFQGGPQILEALGGGSINIGFSNLVSLALANDNGIDFRAITGGPVEQTNHIENAILTLKNGSIKKPQDLAGKKIAINAKKNIIELMVKEYLRKNNVDLNSVEFVEAKFPEMQNALKSKQVDAIATIEPFVTVALKDTSIVRLSNYINDVIDRLEISSYHSSQKWINGNKDLVKRFQNAMAVSTKFCLENPEEVKNVLTKYSKVDKSILKEAMMPTFVEKISSDNFQILIEKMRKDGMLSKDIKASQLIIID